MTDQGGEYHDEKAIATVVFVLMLALAGVFGQSASDGMNEQSEARLEHLEEVATAYGET